MSQGYKVSLEKFEGPLDLLLELIEKEKLDITEISLAKIADQYLVYITQLEEINPAAVADFLLIAAKLILIKSKALLPVLQLDKEEELDIQELKKRLEEYKKFKEAALQIKKIYLNPRVSFAQRFYIEEKRAFCPGSTVNIASLKFAYEGLLKILRKQEHLDKETIKKTVSLEEKIKQLHKLMLGRISLTFSELKKSTKSKFELILTFLAILELTRRKSISAKQNNLFGDIILEKQ